MLDGIDEVMMGAELVVVLVVVVGVRVVVLVVVLVAVLVLVLVVVIVVVLVVVRVVVLIVVRVVLVIVMTVALIVGILVTVLVGGGVGILNVDSDVGCIVLTGITIVSGVVCDFDKMLRDSKNDSNIDSFSIPLLSVVDSPSRFG